MTTEKIIPPGDLQTKYFGKPVERHCFEFGRLLSIILAVWGIFDCIKGNLSFAYILSLSMVVATITFKKPQILLLPWQIWMAFGNILQRIISPIILTILWYIIVTPTALISRAFGHKTLDLTINKDVESYWKVRSYNTPSSKRIRKQS